MPVGALELLGDLDGGVVFLRKHDSRLRLSHPFSGSSSSAASDESRRARSANSLNLLIHHVFSGHRGCGAQRLRCDILSHLRSRRSPERYIFGPSTISRHMLNRALHRHELPAHTGGATEFNADRLAASQMRARAQNGVASFRRTRRTSSSSCDQPSAQRRQDLRLVNDVPAAQRRRYAVATASIPDRGDLLSNSQSRPYLADLFACGRRSDLEFLLPKISFV